MLHTHPDYLARLDHVRRQEALRRAEDWRLARVATAGRLGWVTAGKCWLLCQLGHLLVRCGRRLEAYGSLQVPLEAAG